jgi:hypothetical protein
LSRAETQLFRQPFDRKIALQMCHHLAGQVGEAAAGLGLEPQWLEILLLAPRTFQIPDQLAGYSQRNLTEVFLDQGERQVDSGP